MIIADTLAGMTFKFWSLRVFLEPFCGLKIGARMMLQKNWA